MGNFRNLLDVQEEFAVASNKKLKKSMIMVIVIELLLAGLMFIVGGEEGAIVFAILGGILLLLILVFVIMMNKNNKKKVQIDKSITDLPVEVQQRIEEDCKTGYRLKNVIVCRDCLLMLNGNATAVSLDYLVFVYPSSTTQRVMLIPIVSTHQIVLVDNEQKTYSIDMGASAFATGGALKKPETVKFYEELLKNAPWILFGATNENMKLFRNFKDMVAVVEERHLQYMIANEKKSNK